MLLILNPPREKKKKKQLENCKTSERLSLVHTVPVLFLFCVLGCATIASAAHCQIRQVDKRSHFLSPHPEHKRGAINRVDLIWDSIQTA